MISPGGETEANHDGPPGVVRARTMEYPEGWASHRMPKAAAGGTRRMHVRGFGQTDVGKKREQNEGSFVVDDELGLLDGSSKTTTRRHQPSVESNG